MTATTKTPEEIAENFCRTAFVGGKSLNGVDLIQALDAAGYVIVLKSTLEKWRDQHRELGRQLRELAALDYHDRPPGI